MFNHVPSVLPASARLTFVDETNITKLGLFGQGTNPRLLLVACLLSQASKRSVHRPLLQCYKIKKANGRLINRDRKGMRHAHLNISKQLVVVCRRSIWSSRYRDRTDY